MTLRQMIAAAAPVALVAATLVVTPAIGAEQDRWLIQQLSLSDGTPAPHRPSAGEAGVAGRAGATVASKEGKPGEAAGKGARDGERDRWFARQLSISDGSTER